MVSVAVRGAALDGGLIPRPLIVTHGRTEIGTQPDPPNMDFEWWDPTPPAALGDPVQVWDTIPYTPALYDDPTATYDSPTSAYDSTATGDVASQHYAGVVVELQALAYAGEVRSWVVHTVGGLARWGVTPVKLTGRPAENDVARVQAIAAAAGYTLVVDGAAGATLAAGDVDADALTAVHDVCESSGGMVWQDRTGKVHYTTGAYRKANQSPDLALPPSVIVDAVEWDQQADDIINQVVVSYGPAANRNELTVDDLQSQAEPWGLRSVAVDTVLHGSADASALGALIVARRAWPYWRSMSAAAVLDEATEVVFAAADVNTVVLLPIPRDPGPTPSDPSPWVVEGWVEEWTEGLEHTAAIAVSDQRRWVTTTLRTYTEVNAAGTYATWLAGGANQYLDMLVKGA